MKMNVKLTADELMNVIDAACNEAIDRGYDVCDDEEVEDILAIVDAAMSAIGIDISEEEEEEDFDFDFDEDDDDEEDSIEDMVFIHNGKRTISKANADMLLNMVAELIMNEDDIPFNKKWEVTQDCFLAFCRDHEIECVEMNEDEDE